MTDTSVALIDRLLSAMCAHDGGQAPLAAEVRYTENGQPLATGDGGEEGERMPAPWRIDMADPATGTAVFFGATVETGTPGMLMLRIAERAGAVAEIEAVIVRLETVGEHGGTVTMFQPRLLVPFDPAGFAAPDPALPPRAQGTADASELVAAADRYFDAIEQNDSRSATFADACVRRENGVRVTGNPDAPSFNPAVPDYRPFAMECAEQIDSGLFRRVSRVRGRRHLLVDRERGLVASVALLDQSGRMHEIDVPGVGIVPLPGLDGPSAEEQTSDELFGSRNSPNLRVPTTELVAQLLRVEDGRIAHIEAIARGGPFGMTSGW